MRSIRFSLIVYFLALLAVSLGGISWLAYRSLAETLREKQGSTNALIESQYVTLCKEARIAFDKRLLNRAQTLGHLARSSRPLYEPLNALGAVSSPLHPQGAWNAALWAQQGVNRELVWMVRKLRMEPQKRWIEGTEIYIDVPDDFVFSADATHGQEYFLAYTRHGQMFQRSESAKNLEITFDEQLIPTFMEQHAVEHFDNIEPKPGLHLRRITIMEPVTRFRYMTFDKEWQYLRFATRPRATPSGRTEAKTQKEPAEAMRPPSGEVTIAPVIYIQYAGSTDVLERRLKDLTDDRDEKLAAVAEETREARVALRNRFLWICLAAFAAIVVGGTVLIRHGLVPLDRLSEAVSQVSAKDFRLKIDQGALPRELQPIAARLSKTLDQLQCAFDREKQAAADISHELRTPLAAMMTTLEVALKKSRTPAEYRELIEECRASGEHMADLVERLLALARLDAGAVAIKSEPVDAAGLARQCAQLVRPLVEERGLTLRVHADEPVPLESDPDKLREIVTNLLHNAIQYNKPSGIIDLDVSRDNGHVRLEVRDTGIGIAPEQRQRIFERFYRADPSRHSDTPHAGLGLAIVKSYLDLMGGAISVDSGQDGSTFVVELPADGPSRA
ncbi:MAG: hypothetical protein HY040_15940 [Planctomycetes bacterium]|nr:hypothetical protein [Planctomycetota bacterium]